MTDVDNIDDVLDALEDVIDVQQSTADVLAEIVNRLTRMETRLCVLANALGHGDAMVSKPTRPQRRN